MVDVIIIDKETKKQRTMKQRNKEQRTRKQRNKETKTNVLDLIDKKIFKASGLHGGQ